MAGQIGAVTVQLDRILLVREGSDGFVSLERLKRINPADGDSWRSRQVRLTAAELREASSIVSGWELHAHGQEDEVD